MDGSIRRYGTSAKRRDTFLRVALSVAWIAPRTLGTRCFAWEDVEAARVLAVRPRGGSPILLSPLMSNFVILQELILERVPAR